MNEQEKYKMKLMKAKAEYFNEEDQMTKDLKQIFEIGG